MFSCLVSVIKSKEWSQIPSVIVVVVKRNTASPGEGEEGYSITDRPLTYHVWKKVPL